MGAHFGHGMRAHFGHGICDKILARGSLRSQFPDHSARAARPKKTPRTGFVALPLQSTRSCESWAPVAYVVSKNDTDHTFLARKLRSYLPVPPGYLLRSQAFVVLKCRLPPHKPFNTGLLVVSTFHRPAQHMTDHKAGSRTPGCPSVILSVHTPPGSVTKKTYLVLHMRKRNSAASVLLSGKCLV